MENPKILTKTQKTTPIQTSKLSKPRQYTIQVGAFKTKTNANQMVSNLLQKGYRAHVTSETKNGTSLFKVHFDAFGSKSQALKFAEKFTAEENLSSFITIINLN